MRRVFAWWANFFYYLADIAEYYAIGRKAREAVDLSYEIPSVETIQRAMHIYEVDVCSAGLVGWNSDVHVNACNKHAELRKRLEVMQKRSAEGKQ